MKEYLKEMNMTAKFSKDVDLIWQQRDKDNNEFLDKREARLMINELA